MRSLDFIGRNALSGKNCCDKHSASVSFYKTEVDQQQRGCAARPSLSYLGRRVSCDPSNAIFFEVPSAYQALPTNFQAPSIVNALLYNNGQIYVGGNFIGISGGQQQYVALLTNSVNPANQLVKTFDAKADAQIRTLALTQDTLYVGGDFSKISGQDRVRVAGRGRRSIPGTRKSATGAHCKCAVMPLGQAVYVAGIFTAAGGENRSGIASIHPLFGAASGWDPWVNAAVNAIARTGNLILIGGEFTVVGLHGANPNPATGEPVPYLAAFDAHPAIHNFRKGAAGHYQFDITDGDGLGSTLLIQASETLASPSWLTLKTLDVLGIQDPYDDGTVHAGATSRFYRLQPQP